MGGPQPGYGWRVPATALLPPRLRASSGLAGWVALSALLTVLSLGDVLVRGAGAGQILIAAGMCACAALSWRRPLTAYAGMAIVVVAQAPFGDPLFQHSMPLYCVPAAALMLGVRGDLPHLAVSVVLGVVLFCGVELPADTFAPGDLLFGIALLQLLPVLVGRAHRSRMRLNTELRERMRRLAVDRERRADEATRAERRRIAGELHDLVAHGVSGMVVQAGAARRLVAQGDGRAADSILAIEEGGREALDELRRLLGILRRDDADLALAPQPSLARVGALVARMRDAGLDVGLRVDGAPVGTIGPGVDVAAYRIVEEALHAARRAVPDGRVEVLVAYAGHHVELIVEGASPRPADLVGLRERVRLFGGELHPQRRGGRDAIRAHLPLTGAPA